MFGDGKYGSVELEKKNRDGKGGKYMEKNFFVEEKKSGEGKKEMRWNIHFWRRRKKRKIFCE